jgi:ferric iron reductase protein FhuF
MSVQLRVPELARIQTILDTVGTRRGPAAVHGLVPGLLVEERTGWLPAQRFTEGSALPALVEAARSRWGAGPAAAAALAWKSYAYWMSLPAVLGYATGQVPDMSAGNVLVRLHGAPPFLEVGLRTPTVETAGDLAGYLRRTLYDGHLAAVLDGLQERSRVGRRTLLGSLASAVAYSLTRSADALARPVLPTAATLLSVLGVADLVEITPDLRVRRRTCCLAFTLPEPRICSGCCLPDAP